MPLKPIDLQQRRPLGRSEGAGFGLSAQPVSRRSGARPCAESHGRSVPLVALPFGPCFPWPFFLLFLLDRWEVSTLSGWVSPTHVGWPYPSYDRRAFASSHILYPLGIGLPCGRLSRFDRQPMGLTVFRPQEMQTP
jgi:hypothetical protein